MSAITKFQFHDDTLDAVADGEQRGVTLASLCAPFGLDPNGQRIKLARLEWATTFKVNAVAEDGKIREVVCLDLRSVNGWLFTLQTKTLSHELQSKLLAYQRECADVLADHFLGKRGAPQSNVLESAQTFAQQNVRVKDDPFAMYTLGRAIRRAAAARRRTWQAVEGAVRRTTFSCGWLQVAVFNVPRVVALLEAIEDGTVDLARPKRARKPKKGELTLNNVMQMALFKRGNA